MSTNKRPEYVFSSMLIYVCGFLYVHMDYYIEYGRSVCSRAVAGSVQIAGDPVHLFLCSKE